MLKTSPIRKLIIRQIIFSVLITLLAGDAWFLAPAFIVGMMGDFLLLKSLDRKQYSSILLKIVGITLIFGILFFAHFRRFNIYGDHGWDRQTLWAILNAFLVSCIFVGVIKIRAILFKD